MTTTLQPRIARDTFGRQRGCECCGGDHLLTATVEEWIALTADTPELQHGFLVAGEGGPIAGLLTFCPFCICITR